MIRRLWVQTPLGAIFDEIYFLLPASEGWVKILFSVSLSVHISTGGIPHPAKGRYSIPGQNMGGTPSQVQDGGTPSQIWTGGTPFQVRMWVPHPRSRQGGTPSQVWTWGVGVPPPRCRLEGTLVPPPPPSRSGPRSG